MENLILLSPQEVLLRIGRLRGAAVAAGRTGALLIADNAMLYYLTGRVYSGWAFISVDENVNPVWFVRRPVELTGKDVVEVRKPEEIPSRLEALGISLPEAVGLEMDALPYSTITRLQAVFPGAESYTASPIVAAARSVKTPLEISMMERSGVIHTAVYHKIPSLFSPGMTDFELDVAIEHLSRLEGCLGQFRICPARTPTLRPPMTSPSAERVWIPRSRSVRQVRKSSPARPCRSMSTATTPAI